MESPQQARIAYLTAGAAGMYCGSCMRDNTLAAILAKRGIDIQLIPTYTPITTDEESVAIDKIFFGGLNVYLQQKLSFFRLLPSWLDRLLDQPRLINFLASRGMKTSARELGELTVAMLKGAAGPVRKEVFRLSDWLAHEFQPDLINFTNILIGGCIPTIRKQTKAPIVVTLQGDDLFLLDLPSPYKDEAITLIKRIAEDVDAFVTFSNYYADFMTDLVGLDRKRVHVIPMGVRAQDFTPSPASPKERPPTLGYFARVCPAKGFHRAVDLFLHLRQKAGTENLQFRAAGWLGEGDKEFFAREKSKIEQAGAAHAFHFAAAVDRDEKRAFFHDIDLLAVPTTYREPKGLFALEALASAIPVALPAHGSFPEIITRTGGGLLLPPESIEPWINPVHDLLTHPERARQLGEQGRQGLLAHHSADVMADKTWEIYTRLLARAPQ